MGKDLNKTAMRIACLTCVCLTVCLVLATGVTLARYSWEPPIQSYAFTASQADQVVLHGGTVDQSHIDAGSLPALPEGWDATMQGAELEFSVTNGEVEKFAQRDQYFTLRLIAGAGVEAPEDLTVTLSWLAEDGSVIQCVAKPELIRAGTFLYETYGSGWVYRFYTEETELEFFLSGGQLSYLNFQITAQGIVDPTLLELQAVGRFA